MLAGGPQMRPPLIDLAYQLTKNNSLMIVGDVIPIKISYHTKMAIIKEGNSWLENRKIKAFYNITTNMEFEEGVKALVQASGFGKLSPNILMMGYKTDWNTCSKSVLKSYFSILQ